MTRSLITTQSIVDQSNYQGVTNVGFGQFTNIRYRGQTFTPTQSVLSSLGLWLADTGVTVDYVVYLTDVDQGTHLPIGSPLASWTISNATLSQGSFALYNLSPNYTNLTPAHEYGIYLAPFTSGSYVDFYQSFKFKNSSVYGKEITNTNGVWSTENLTLVFSVGYPTSRTTAGRRQIARNFGTCLSFGTGKNVQVADNVAFRPTSVTLSCWIKPNSMTGTQTYIRRWNTGGYILRTDGSSHLQILLQTNATKTLNGTITPTLGQWCHISATYNETTGACVLYINGVADNSTTHAGGALTYGSTHPLYIGNSNVNEFFNGLEDDVRIYSTDLTATQILNLYYGIEPPTTNMVSWYKFDEGSGTVATDSSASGLNGTITSATYSTDVYMKPRTVVT